MNDKEPQAQKAIQLCHDDKSLHHEARLHWKLQGNGLTLGVCPFCGIALIAEEKGKRLFQDPETQ